MKLLILLLLLAVFTGCTSDNANVDSHDHAHDHGPSMDHTGHEGHDMPAGMDHAAMESSPGAAEAPIELQFIDTMIAHHEGAVHMARMAETRGGDSQFKALAVRMVEAQEREITEMKRWRAKWFEGQPPAINMDFPGMRDGMAGMDMTKLATLNGKEFDLEFVKQMIEHHEGAIVMSRELKEAKEYPELRKLADTIIKDQQAEIVQMRKWQSEWSAPTQ